jgi:hypothetical protein
MAQYQLYSLSLSSPHTQTAGKKKELLDMVRIEPASPGAGEPESFVVSQVNGPVLSKLSIMCLMFNRVVDCCRLPGVLPLDHIPLEINE